MSHLTTEQACYSLPPAELDYTPKGEWSEKGLAGLKTYTIKSGSKNALIYIYDIGGYAPQNFQGADMLSGSGLDVFIPDMFKGQGMDLKKMPSLSDEEKAAIREKFNAGVGNSEEQSRNLAAMAKELKSQGYEKVAAVGFCWGGTLVARTPELDAGAMVHPGKDVDRPLAEKLSYPTCLLPSMNEDEERMNAFHQTMLSKPVGPKCVLKFYKDMLHGWCASRADLTDPNVKEKFQDAFQVMSDFFGKVL